MDRLDAALKQAEATIERQAKVIAAADAMRESYRGYELGREIFAAYDAAAIRALTDQPAKGSD